MRVLAEFESDNNEEITYNLFCAANRYYEPHEYSLIADRI